MGSITAYDKPWKKMNFNSNVLMQKPCGSLPVIVSAQSDYSQKLQVDVKFIQGLPSF